MKELLTLQGGYPRVTDYVLNLQNEFLTASNSMFASLAVDMVLKGCAVTDNGNGTVNIAAGLVYIGGEVLRYDGAANIAADGTKALIKGGYVATDPADFADTLTKNLYREAKAIVGDKTSDSQIVIRVQITTLKTYIENLAASAAFKGEKKTIIDLDGTFLDNFDASGLGVVAPYIGWARYNGNNGLPNGAGRISVPSGMFTDPVSGLEVEYVAGDLVGEFKHQLTQAELPHVKLQIPINKTKRGSGSGFDGQAVCAPGGDVFGGAGNLETAFLGDGTKISLMQPGIVEHVIVKIL